MAIIKDKNSTLKAAKMKKYHVQEKPHKALRCFLSGTFTVQKQVTGGI